MTTKINWSPGVLPATRLSPVPPNPIGLWWQYPGEILMEEFRPLIADSLVFSVFSHKELKPKDFSESLGAYRLSETGRKTFLEAFERKMNLEFNHPVFGYPCSYRRAVELQARLLSRHLQEGIAYKPLSLR